MQFFQTGECKHTFSVRLKSKCSPKKTLTQGNQLKNIRVKIYIVSCVLLLLFFTNTSFAQPLLSINDWQIDKQGDTFILCPDADSSFVYTVYRQTTFTGQELDRVFDAFVKNIVKTWGTVHSCSGVKIKKGNNPNFSPLNECNLSVQKGNKTSTVTFMGYVKNGFLRYCSIAYSGLNKERKVFFKEAQAHFAKIRDYDWKNLPVTDAKLWIMPESNSLAQRVLTKDSLYVASITKPVTLFNSDNISQLSDSITRVRRKEHEIAVRTKEINKFRPNKIIQPYDSASRVCYILIAKSQHRLFLCDSIGWLVSYPVVFGAGGSEEKKVQGDQRTPEGNFHITDKRIHKKWDKFLAIDYPTKEDIEKFDSLKSAGKITKEASIGGGIGIHGTWPHDDFMIDRYKNWTDGCISMKNHDIDELYNFVYRGMLVKITP
jgi:lipoprotein-anchoring transpeptidase ErfK/SrfK